MSVVTPTLTKKKRTTKKRVSKKQVKSTAPKEKRSGIKKSSETGIKLSVGALQLLQKISEKPLKGELNPLIRIKFINVLEQLKLISSIALSRRFVKWTVTTLGKKVLKENTKRFDDIAESVKLTKQRKKEQKIEAIGKALRAFNFDKRGG